MYRSKISGVFKRFLKDKKDYGIFWKFTNLKLSTTPKKDTYYLKKLKY